MRTPWTLHVGEAGVGEQGSTARTSKRRGSGSVVAPAAVGSLEGRPRLGELPGEGPGEDDGEPLRDEQREGAAGGEDRGDGASVAAGSSTTSRVPWQQTGRGRRVAGERRLAERCRRRPGPR